MYLFLWNNAGNKKELVHISLGMLIIRRGDVYYNGHGGETGNLRLHLTISIDPHATKLCYSEKNDIRENWLTTFKKKKIDMKYNNQTSISILTYIDESKIMDYFLKYKLGEEKFSKERNIKTYFRLLSIKFPKANTKKDITNEEESVVNDDEIVDENDTKISSSDNNYISECSSINIKSVKLSITPPQKMLLILLLSQKIH